MKDLICFSHLRWDFVFQRPQHLMTRFSQEVRVFYIEEPVWTPAAEDKWVTRQDAGSSVTILVPALGEDVPGKNIDDRLQGMLSGLIRTHNIHDCILWYYSPMALAFSDHLSAEVIVYDCMDELSAFRGAPPELVTMEKNLLEKADIVFTGGHRLYEAKRQLHDNIFPFPSSIDKAVFAPARQAQADPADQAQIGHPRFGFFGVIDERFDTLLVKEIATAKPEWHFVFVGPVVKIDPADLPRLSNIHYLGIKNYKQLPGYISGWDICIMPFAINAATEFISPTKTPEFLAAGKRVISTPVHDVIHPYGDNGLVGIADSAASFSRIAEQYLLEKDNTEWLGRADEFLADLSWDKTSDDMWQLIAETAKKKKSHQAINQGQYV